MNKSSAYKKIGVVVAFLMMFTALSTQAFASDSKVKWSISLSSFFPYGHAPRHKDISYRGKKYRYRHEDGKFYRRGYLGMQVVVPPVGIIVETLPFASRTIIINGETYYNHDNVYYKHCHAGYIVVPSPVNQPHSLSDNTITINISNPNGTYTAVSLVKHKNGYVGPQGEFYSKRPTVEQLRVLYGS